MFTDTRRERIPQSYDGETKTKKSDEFENIGTEETFLGGRVAFNRK